MLVNCAGSELNPEISHVTHQEGPPTRKYRLTGKLHLIDTRATRTVGLIAC
jgi:hypothetical protein